MTMPTADSFTITIESEAQPFGLCQSRECVNTFLMVIDLKEDERALVRQHTSMMNVMHFVLIQI